MKPGSRFEPSRSFLFSDFIPVLPLFVVLRTPFAAGAHAPQGLLTQLVSTADNNGLPSSVAQSPIARLLRREAPRADITAFARVSEVADPPTSGARLSASVPLTSSVGGVGVLADRAPPAASSKSTTSVNVLPTSTPMRRIRSLAPHSPAQISCRGRRLSTRHGGTGIAMKRF